MKPVDVKSNTYIDSSKEVNNKDPKFSISDVGYQKYQNIRYKNENIKIKISKYKNIFAKGYTPNQSEEFFVIKKVKNIVPWTCY